MMKNYFLLEGKRSLFVLRKSIMSVVCVILVLGMVVLAAYHLMTQTTVFPKVEVGVVLEDDSDFMDMAMGYIAGMESVESICNFNYVDSEDGKQMLAEGKLQAVIILPDSMYEELDSLKHSKAMLLLPEGEQLGTRMFGQLLSSGVGLLQVAEAGVKASYDVTKGQILEFSRSELGYFLATKYALQALERMSTFDEIVASPIGVMSSVQFYFLALFLCVCLICGLNFSYLYERKQKALENKLCIEGVGRIKQSVVKIVLMALYLFVIELFIYIFGCVLSEITPWYFLGFDLMAIFLMMCLSVAMSTHFHMVYSLAKDEKQGTLLLLVSSILLVICAGLVIPQAYLPEVAQWVGNCSPILSWSLLGQSALYGADVEVALFASVVWFIVELGIGVYCSWKKDSFGISFP